MQRAETDGERILVTQQPGIWFKKMVEILYDEFRPQGARSYLQQKSLHVCFLGYRMPWLQVNYAMVWLFSFLSVDARLALGRLNKRVAFSNEKV